MVIKPSFLMDPKKNPAPTAPELLESGHSASTEKFTPWISGDTVVTRDQENQPLSYFRDDSWDFSAISRVAYKKIHFIKPAADDANGDADQANLFQTIKEQSKTILWKFLEDGELPEFPTAYRLNLTLNFLCEQALKKRISILALFKDEKLLFESVDTENLAILRNLGSILNILHKNRKLFGIDIAHLELKERLSAMKAELPNSEQTPVIPSRIYEVLLGGMLQELDEIEKDIDLVLPLYDSIVNIYKGTPDNLSKLAREKHLAQALKNVKAVAQSFGFDPKRQQSSVRYFIQGVMARYQVSLMHTVAAFSGMRRQECQHLPTEGVLGHFEDFAGKHWLINGFSHKLAKGGDARTSWITNESGRRALLAAEKISDAIHNLFGVQNSARRRYLFCSTENPYNPLSTALVYRQQAQLRKRISPTIFPADMEELERIQLDRDWSLKDIAAGLPWPLAFHQLRRSLAIYANRSGMVTLSSLKGQLQHLTVEMTMYYSKSFLHAASVVFDKSHFSHEWNASAAESSYLGFAMGLILSDDVLFGGGAAWAMSKKVRDSPISVHSKEHALNLFKKGQIAYTETPLGGCTSTESCKSSPLYPIPYECLKTNCKNLVVYEKRLVLAIGSQQRVIDSFGQDQSSVGYRLEAANFQTLLGAHASLKQVN